MNVSRWLVSQLGAREHYAVARALHRRGKLRWMYTDVWCRFGASTLQRCGGAARAIAGRQHEELPSDRVVSFTSSTLMSRLRFSVRSGSLASLEDAAYKDIAVGRAFAKRVRRHLERQSLDPSVDRFFAYNTGCLETLQLLRERGVVTVVDQIDPARVEEELVYAESQKWPTWQTLPGRIPDAYWERLAEEWRLASSVLVNSNWSKQALAQQGVDAGKIIVVPLAFEPNIRAEPIRSDRARPLLVLWLGSVILRKGIQYLIEAAKLLERDGANVRFVVAGPVYISDDAVKSAPSNVSFVGRVTRDRTSEFYRSADVFVLPTISDGFAITQIEAMAHGLPVIATPNCGDVVTDGVDGLIVPVQDAAALAEAIARLESDRVTISAMSEAALRKSRQFSLDAFADRLEAAAMEHDAARPPLESAR